MKTTELFKNNERQGESEILHRSVLNVHEDQNFIFNAVDYYFSIIPL